MERMESPTLDDDSDNKADLLQSVFVNLVKAVRSPTDPQADSSKDLVQYEALISQKAGISRLNCLLLDKDSSLLNDVLSCIELSSDLAISLAFVKSLQVHIDSALTKSSCTKRTKRLVAANGVHSLIKLILKLLKTEATDEKDSERLIICSVALLLKIAPKDRKFALKIRLSGLLNQLVTEVLAGPASTDLLTLFSLSIRSAQNSVTVVKLKDFPNKLLLLLQTANISNEFVEKYCEVLYFLCKNRAARMKLNVSEAVPICLSLVRRFFDRFDTEPVDLSILLVSLGCLRQLARTNAAKETLIKSGALASCEAMIASIAAGSVDVEAGSAAAKVQTSLCALCVRCLPMKDYPLLNVPLPLKFDLPHVKRLAPSGESSGDSADEEADAISNDPDSSIAQFSDDDNDNKNGPQKLVQQKASHLDQYAAFYREMESGAVDASKSAPNMKGGPHCDLYKSEAAKVNSVAKFVKLAYPDYAGCFPDLPMQPLKRYEHALRDSVLAELERHRKSEVFSPRTVYDLDTILKANQKNSALDCLDLQQIGISDPSRDHLKFESRFESGNLRRVIQTSPTHYELFMCPDVNQLRHHYLWFYFQVSNMRADTPYSFQTVNSVKSQSMFSTGMQPLIFSVTEAKLGRPGWVRAGYDICYRRNRYVQPSCDTKKKKSSESKGFFSVQFTMTFRHENDICYVAYHFPYTYSLLMTQLRLLGRNLDKSIYFRQDELAKSLGGNVLMLLTITEMADKERLAERDVIFLSARVHPGETNASWMMQGAVEFLLSSHPKASELRHCFVFKIVPMLNVDGVINGSHRCSLAGQDLNRQWAEPTRQLHPVIFHTKAVMQYLVQVLQKKPLIYCDFHGHSRKYNVFMYGNNPEESWWNPDHAMQHHGEFMTFPEILDRCTPAFTLNECRFAIQKDKEPSARVAVWRQLGITRSYTMEATYCGFNSGPYQGNQIGTHELREMGRCFCECLLLLKSSTLNSVKSASSSGETRSSLSSPASTNSSH